MNTISNFFARICQVLTMRLLGFGVDGFTVHIARTLAANSGDDSLAGSSMRAWELVVVSSSEIVS